MRVKSQRSSKEKSTNQVFESLSLTVGLMEVEL